MSRLEIEILISAAVATIWFAIIFFTAMYRGMEF